MFTSLNPGAIGIKASTEEGLRLAHQAGFEGLDFNVVEVTALVDRNGLDFCRHLFAEYGIRGGAWGLPVNFRKDEASWQQGLEALGHQAQVAAALGWTRCNTWILPFSDELDYDANMAFHAQRLRPIAQTLGEHGVRLGLEYVGPLTLRQDHAHNFIHDLAGWRELCAAIGTDNLGLLLDAFHWHTSSGTKDDLLSLRNEEVVLVHMNDALPGRSRDEQIDNERALPGETGVIDLTTFLQALDAIGYDGPLTVEPFSQRIRDLLPQQAAVETAASLDGVLRDAGLR